MHRIAKVDWRRELRVAVGVISVCALLLAALSGYYFFVPSFLRVSVINASADSMDRGEVLVGRCRISFARLASGHRTEETIFCVPVGDVRINSAGAAHNTALQCGYLTNPVSASLLKTGRIELHITDAAGDGVGADGDLRCEMQI